MRVEQPWGFIGPAVMTLGGATAVGGSFAVWLRTGAVRRSSYEILGLVDRLGFAPDGPIRTAVRGWPLMPLVVTASVVAAWWGLRQVAAALGIVGGLYAGALGIAIASAVPGHRLVSVTAAPTITAIGAAVQIVGSVLAIAVRSSALEVETAEVTNATRPDPRAPHATLPGGRS